nr:hypothetical protein [uncultured Flavobacterium sp.]
MEIINSLSNREIAILFWIVVIFTVLIFISKSSNSFLGVVKAFFDKKLVYCYIIIGAYLFLVITILNKTIFWEAYLFKDFAIWLVGFAMVSFFNINKINTNSELIKRFLKIFSATIIIDFSINFFTFNLGWELIIVPVVSFIAILQYFAEINKEKPGYEQVSSFLKWVLTIIGFSLLGYVIHKLYHNYNEILKINNLKSFLIPVILSVLYFPIILLFASVMKYENIFQEINRYGFLDRKRKLKIKLTVIIYGKLNLDKLEKIKNWDKRELKDNSNIFKYLKSLVSK